jgi:hypothetical protein
MEDGGDSEVLLRADLFGSVLKRIVSLIKLF